MVTSWQQSDQRPVNLPVSDLISNSIILFFDGYCPFCTGIIKILLKLDAHKKLRYSTIHSETFQKATQQFKEIKKFDSVVVLKGDIFFIKSDAVFAIIDALGGIWRILNVFRIIPRNIRKKLYDFIASRRKRWFGIRQTCYLPTPEEKKYFLS